MRFLEICDDDSGNISPWASGRLFATMLYPGATESEERARIFREMLLHGFEADSVKSDIARLSKAARKHIDEIRAIALGDHHRAGIGSATLLNQAIHRAAAGMLAGTILRYLLRCIHHHRPDRPEHASFNKAYYVVNGLADLAAKKSGAKSGIGVGETKLAEHWKIHSAGCHLQAAALALDLDGSEWLTNENIPAFLDVSEIYRFAGEAAGFLDPSMTWRPPPAFPTTPPTEMDLSAEVLDSLFPPLNDSELKILATYRAN
jgi:hypothetical protein